MHEMSAKLNNSLEKNFILLHLVVFSVGTYHKLPLM